MSVRTGCIAAAAVLLICRASIAAEPVSLPADLILSRGEIYAPGEPGGWVASLAIKNGVIIAVGEDAAVRKHQAPATRVIDLNGAAVLPGLHDMHVHPLMAGHAHQQCAFPQGSGPKAVKDAIAACVSQRGKGEWILGGQWDAASFGRQPVHKALLDSVAPDHPVALADISLHSLWVNTKALQLAGITSATPNPDGGIIERDAKGNPTGVLRESAGALVRAVIPPYKPEQDAAALQWSLDTMLAYGITSFTDALAGEDALAAYAQLADRGVLKQRVTACIPWRTALLGGMDTGVIERRNLYARERVSPSCIKMVLDGVPTDAHTAAMLEPYAGVADNGDERARGLLLVPTEELKAATIRFDASGLKVKFHAAGDGAVRAALDAIEAARKANGFSGPLHEVSHNSFVSMADIARARGLAAVFEFSPYIWFENPIIGDIRKAVGDERMQRWIPVKDALDAGALVVPGSDWSVVPSVNPWPAIETLVTRQTPGGQPPALAPSQSISLPQAIGVFTINSARAAGHADTVGTIAPGMLADVIVVDRNPFKSPIANVTGTRVTMTIIGGEIVFRATASAGSHSSP